MKDQHLGTLPDSNSLADMARGVASPKAPADLDKTLDFASADTGGSGAAFISSDPSPTDGSISRITLVPEDLLGKEGSSSESSHAQRAEPAEGLAGPHGESKPGKVSRLGDFVLVQKLGSGGMGVVYRARQMRRGRDVAVKVLYANLANRETVVARFYREARLMTKLDHPNILNGYEVGAASGLHYFAMELASGGSVEDWRARLGRFSIGDSVHVVLACARALQHAHALGLIHRDVKPDNMLITARGIVKLADLGLAKATAGDIALTQSHTGVGTPLYMSFEQALNAKHVDARTDIYAMGCMFYYFLTGKPPFNGKGLLGVMQAKEKGVYLPARQLRPELPEALDPIIAKMIAKLPEQRYSTCTEFMADLEPLSLANDELGFFSNAISVAKAASEPTEHSRC